jgi:hypothetical protein
VRERSERDANGTTHRPALEAESAPTGAAVYCGVKLVWAVHVCPALETVTSMTTA